MSDLQTLGLVEQLSCGRIRQIGLTAEQKRMLELSLAAILRVSDQQALVGMPPEHDLILKRNVNRWSDVNERLPSDDDLYLVYYPTDSIKHRITFFSTNIKRFNYYHDRIAYWMPLPEAPMSKEPDQ